MTMQCEIYRRRILEASLHELNMEERHFLEAHLADCSSCAEEQRLTLDILQQLGSQSDVAVPRHFFVTKREAPLLTPWSLFRQMSFAWKATAAVTLVALGALAMTAVFSVEVKRQGSSFTVSFGKHSNPTTNVLQASLIADKLKAEILQVIEEKSREERLSWIRQMRKEVILSNRRLSVRQRNLLETALTGLEARVDEQIFTRERSLQAGWERSMSDLYRAIQAQRKQDLMVTRTGIERLAAQGEVRSDQTDAILATLLQAAEYRTK